MNIDELIYSPIVTKDELYDLIKKIIDNPNDRKLLDSVSDRIVEIFSQHGITDEQKIVDAIYRKIREIEKSIERNKND